MNYLYVHYRHKWSKRPSYKCVEHLRFDNVCVLISNYAYINIQYLDSNGVLVECNLLKSKVIYLCLRKSIMGAHDNYYRKVK